MRASRTGKEIRQLFMHGDRSEVQNPVRDQHSTRGGVGPESGMASRLGDLGAGLPVGRSDVDGSDPISGEYHRLPGG